LNGVARRNDIRPSAVRWIAISIFVFSGVLNYLDRQILATMVDIWRTRPDFPFTYEDYGLLLTVFSLAYAISSPIMGWFLDRVGLNRGISISVFVWALASIGTGLVNGLGSLLVCRAILGVAEAGGVAAAGKAIGKYLLPRERGVGTAMSQLGLSLGAGLAPHFAVYFAYQHSWRWAFYTAGGLSLMWIPVWLLTSRAIPPIAEADGHVVSFKFIRDRRVPALVLANFLAMTIFSLWTNWTPTYLVKVLHLTPEEARNYSWIVPICGYFGAMLGGGLSWAFINRGVDPVAARKRVCVLASFALLGTMAVPLLSTPVLATIGMSFSFFCINAWSANMYTIPVDLFGAEGAAFGVGALLFGYGAMQTVISRPLAQVITDYGFAPVCITFAVLPLVAQLPMRRLISDPSTDHPGVRPTPLLDATSVKAS
jgi:ACS family hexuronate transporter-like MFS transporter